MVRDGWRRLGKGAAWRVAALVSALYFLYYGSGAAWFPFFNPYLREIGLTGVQIGLMGGIRPSVMLLSQPLWGMAADAWGRRRLLILTALVVALVVPGYRLGQTFGFLMLWTILYTALNNPIGLLLDSVTLDHLERYGGLSYGVLRLWGAAGWAIVAVVAGRLLSNGDPRAMFYYAGALLLGLGLTTLGLPREEEGQRSLRRAWAGVGVLLRRRALIIFLAVVTLLQLGTVSIFSFYSIYLGEIGASRDLIGLAFSIQGLSELPVYLGSAWIIRKIGPERALTVSFAAYATRALLYSVIRTPALAVATEVLHGLSFSLFLVSSISYVNAHTPPEWRATGQSLLWAFCYGAGQILGSAWGGWLYDSVGVQNLYRVCGLFIAAVAVGSIVMLWPRKGAGALASVGGAASDQPSALG